MTAPQQLNNSNNTGGIGRSSGGRSSGGRSSGGRITGGRSSVGRSSGGRNSVGRSSVGRSSSGRSSGGQGGFYDLHPNWSVANSQLAALVGKQMPALNLLLNAQSCIETCHIVTHMLLFCSYAIIEIILHFFKSACRPALELIKNEEEEE
jgi:hypothetical protein